MFASALFVSVKYWHQSKCSNNREMINNLQVRQVRQSVIL